jgi:hypothetical protein
LHDNFMNRFATVLTALVVAGLPSASWADNAKFTFLKTVSVAELDQILDEERNAFIKSEGLNAGPGYKLPSAPKATNAVDIYTVTYETTIPERNHERVLVSGMMALPRVADRSKMPLMSYQHGTVYHKYGVPSYAFQSKSPWPYDHKPESFEDRYMVALFGGNGYGVIAADYVGFGVDANNGEAYMIKGVTAQASVDLYSDVKSYLASQKITPSGLFLSGWSQGAHNTSGMLQKLESQGVKVRAAFTAANPNDPFAAMNAVLLHQLPTDSPWFSGMIGQTAFSCEKFGGPVGLVRNTLNPEFFDQLASIYTRSYGSPAGDSKVLMAMLTKWKETPLVTFLKKEIRDPSAFAASDYGRCLARNEVFRQDIKADVRMYYGTSDEIIRQPLGRLGSDYQTVLKGVPITQAKTNIVPIAVQGGTHRRTFLTGSVDAKTWMDQMR